MKRNRKGEVSLGNVEIKVPQDCSVLSVVGNNEVFDGEDFHKDGYVYNNGKRIRRWFTSIGKFRLWKPHLKEISRIEKVFVETHALKLKKWNEIFKPVYDKCFEVANNESFSAEISIPKGASGIVHFMIYKGQDNPWVKWTWADNHLDNRNDSLGQEYFNAEHRSMKYSNYVWMANCFLIEAVTAKALDEGFYDNSNVSMLHMVINGNHYWFRKGSYGIEMIGDTLHTMKIEVSPAN